MSNNFNHTNYEYQDIKTKVKLLYKKEKLEYIADVNPFI